jgi:hypothetical protein
MSFQPTKLAEIPKGVYILRNQDLWGACDWIEFEIL